MALLVCRACKKAFISTQHEEKACPDCAPRLHKLYSSVRNFLRDNERKVYTPQDVCRIMNISPDDMSAMVSMGLLDTVPGSRSQDASTKQLVSSYMSPKIRDARRRTL